MKKPITQIFASFILVILIALSFSSCIKDECISTREYIRYDPVYKTIEELRTDISVSAAKELLQPGNINYYNGYMLINEVLEGVHIIDNRDPSNPINLAFIDIPGSRDLAVRNGVLYVDSYLDLLSIDITTPTQPVLIHREEDIFQGYIPRNGEFNYLVDYEKTNVTEVLDCTNNNWGRDWFFIDEVLWGSVDANFDVRFTNSPTSSSSNQSSIATGVGIGGSMARFTIAKSHLYVLDQFQMQVFDLASTIPQNVAEVPVTGRIETIFPAGDNLFIGTDIGMKIYDNSNPAIPVYLSEFAHAQACDPVFVAGEFAYVTLRDGSICNNADNQLDVLDISNLLSPKIIKSYNMHNPHGLSVVNNKLFLCDGSAGLKVYDVADKNRIDKNLLSRITDIDTKDVIVLPPGNLVMVIGDDGFYQFDASDPTNLVALSVLPIVRK